MKNNNRAILALAAALAAALVTPNATLAASLKGAEGWKSTYNAAGKMVENYNASEYVDQVSHLQPGDDITFTVSAVHENDDAADWYVSNDVITSLENSKADAEGSNYEYLLQWEGPKQSRTLYDSEHVGGDRDNASDPEGLNEATDAMDEFIFLENMKKGQSGKVTLKVSLDGETEGNAYFDTLAQVKVRFAVEPNPTDEKTIHHERTITQNRELVRTGDETRLFPLYVAMFVSGVALMGLLVWSIRDRRNENEEATR